jgi:DegV family protein with EDD domain
MIMIKIMADSTCDLSKEFIEKYDIGIATLNIMIGDKVYKDRIDLSSDEFFEMLPALDELPTTSMPSPEEYVKIIDQGIVEGMTEFLCICMSSGTSASYTSAELAKKLFYERNPDSKIKIHVVDSLSMSHGSGWLIIKSAQLLEEGWSFEQLVEFNEKYKIKTKHFLCVDDLNNLIKSGRLSNTSAFIGKLLRVKPIMTMKNSRGAIIAKERGWNKVLKYYVSEYLSRVNLDITNFIIIGYTSDIHIAYALRDKMLKDTDFGGDIYIMQMGVAVGTHVGLGGVSMYFIEK